MVVKGRWHMADTVATSYGEVVDFRAQAERVKKEDDERAEKGKTRRVSGLRDRLIDYDDQVLTLLELVMGYMLREQLMVSRQEFAMLGKGETVRRIGLTVPSFNAIESEDEDDTVPGSNGMVATTLRNIARMLAVYGLGLKMEVVTMEEMKEWVEGWDVDTWRQGLKDAGGSTRVEVKEDDEPDPMKYGDDGRNDPGYESEDDDE